MKFKNAYLLAGMLFIIITGFKAHLQKNPTSEKWNMVVALYFFHQHSFEKGLDMAVFSGLKNVEGFSFQNLGDVFGSKTIKDFTPDEISKMKKTLADRNLKMPSMYISDAKGKEDWENYFKTGSQFGIQYFVAEPNKEDLDVINQLVGKYKIKVAIHVHARPNPYWHPDSVLTAIKGRKNLGACRYRSFG